MKANRQRGVALIITLIMLSIITVMAVAFLALSRRERSSVVHSGNSLDAELAASGGLERAKAEILANIISSGINGITNFPLGPDLLVSGARTTNPPPLYQGPEFYYEDWKPKGSPADAADKAAIASLWRDARPPVFVVTNRAFPNNREQRFYLDLNRNGKYDTNGFLLALDETGNKIFDRNNGGFVSGLFTGDPEWLGILSKPGFQHSKDNRFIGRYAYIVLPVGRSLDLNFIHNDAARRIGGNPQLDGYHRNQGVGSWEINLAAFLTDLNPGTNGYGPPEIYVYNPFTGNRGPAFEDAKNLLSFRYNGDWKFLATAGAMFPANAFISTPGNPINFTNDLIDAYLFGPLTPFGARPVIEGDLPAQQWPGSDSLKHFFSIHDFFRGRTPKYNLSGLTNRIGGPTASLSSEDRYAYYRMLAQLGTDSTPEPDGKVNINYNNLSAPNPATGTISATNFIAWTPIEFFTNAAARMFREEFKTNIDIYASMRRFRIPVGSRSLTNLNGEVIPLYSSRVHRLLQVSANIYEATVGLPKANETQQPFFPSVFRPVFEQVNGILYITNYVEETDPKFARRVLSAAQGVGSPITLHDLNELTTNANPIFTTNDMFYGVPLIIGARKGYPNFNEFAVQTIADFTRKLEVRKEAPNGRTTETNQMFIMGISNVFAMEAWNSYTNDYPRPVNLVFQNTATATLTNNLGLSTNMVFGGGTNILVNSFTANQFRTAGISLNVVMPPSVYRPKPAPVFDSISTSNIFDRTGANYTNQWGLRVRNKFVYFLVDGNNIVDAVTGSDFSGDFDISRELNNPVGDGQKLWNNGLAGYATIGAQSQLDISAGNRPVADWNSYGYNPVSGNDKNKAIDGFRMFLGLPPLYNPTNALPAGTLATQAPFTPTRKMIHTSRWEANDPLVHYLSDDLRKYDVNSGLTNDVVVQTVKPSDPISITDNTSIGRRNDRYSPWGGNPDKVSANDPTAFDLRVKDPGVAQSDFWDFPTQKFPSIGWLGRVHRGTPWQTLYLKAYPMDVDPDKWMMPAGGPGLAMQTHPTNDWKLLDLFTTAIHPNATRGRLSINQTNSAAWSAVLSGVGVTSLADLAPSGGIQRTNLVIEPAAFALPLRLILDGISRERARMGRFEQLGDILRVPELTVLSPYLNVPFISQRAEPEKPYVLKDIDYERIPDQILSLLKMGEPRFVIYAFGQSLKPEYVDPATGLALNYQITGEVSTRAVVRVEFDPLPITDPNDPLYGKPDVTRPHAVVETFNILPPE